MVGITVRCGERKLSFGCEHAKLAQDIGLAEVFTRSEGSAVGPEAGQATRYFIAFLPDQLAKFSYHLLIRGATLFSEILSI